MLLAINYDGLSLLNASTLTKELISHWSWDKIQSNRCNDKSWHVVVGSLVKPEKLNFSAPYVVSVVFLCSYYFSQKLLTLYLRSIQITITTMRQNYKP